MKSWTVPPSSAPRQTAATAQSAMLTLALAAQLRPERRDYPAGCSHADQNGDRESSAGSADERHDFSFRVGRLASDGGEVASCRITHRVS